MTRHFSLLVDDRPETLLRVTGLCLRRRADVVALRYGRSRHAGWSRLDLELEVDERHGRGLAERLAALVEVRHLAELRDGAAAPAVTPPLAVAAAPAATPAGPVARAA